ncbi:hypothetical protein SAMN04515647_0130 [Cohaesibacter sp. ES.047]|uniref:hypothetical protein n=1 Tax=Cohaesibacter sp. ES.047 TaxID=1798205 RepID=UPI000BB96E47|nr:hypothetical protein [Cohaesibacter sp. ES.047]SNY89989.1 hypothetical protein SAMN04515647_0130 [Cohaesibacter sp. ES.047]
MRKALLPLLAAGMTLLASHAYADSYTGVYNGFDYESSMLILDEEKLFLVPEEIDLPDMEPGDVVTVEYEDQDDILLVNSVTLSQ